MTNPHSRRGRTASRLGMSTVEFQIQTPLLQRVENWAATWPDTPTRSEAMRRLIAAGLCAEETGKNKFQTC